MRKTTIILLAIGIVLIGFCTGIYINKISQIEEENKIAKQTIEDECTQLSELYELGLLDVTQTNGEDKKVSPNAILIIKKHYKQCGHTVQEQASIPAEAVNLREEQFENLYKEWELIGFSNEEIVIQKEIEGICNEHYIIREKDGYIAVYGLDEKGQETLKKMTEISTKYLTQTDLLNLKNGINAVGKEELNSILEDFE